MSDQLDSQVDPFDSPADWEEFGEFVEEASLDLFERQLLDEIENDLIMHLTRGYND